jgi:hypothetical protein
MRRLGRAVGDAELANESARGRFRLKLDRMRPQRLRRDRLARAVAAARRPAALALRLFRRPRRPSFARRVLPVALAPAFLFGRGNFFPAAL